MSSTPLTPLPTSTLQILPLDAAETPVVVRNPMFSVSIAAGVCALLALSPAVERLPAFGCAVAFLFLAIESDVRTFRLPNLLTLPALALALAFAFGTGGFPALGTALLGAGVAFALTFPLFALGALGAGDAKALMALGALTGAVDFLGMLWWMVVCGGVLGISIVVLRGGALDLARRWGRTLKVLLFSRHWKYERPSVDSPAHSGRPFAVAIGLGMSAYFTWGLPWIA